MTGYEFLKFLTVNIEGSISTGKEQNDCTATGFYAIINDDTVLATAKHFTAQTNLRMPENISPAPLGTNHSKVSGGRGR